MIFTNLFDLITKVTIKNPEKSACCCLCPSFPFYVVQLDTGSSTPTYAAQATEGLLEPAKFQKMVWAMKREKGEQIHRDMREELRYSNQMKFGQSATNETINTLGYPVSPQSGGWIVPKKA